MNNLMSKHRLAFLRALGQVTANLRKKLKRSDEVQIHVPPELKGRLPRESKTPAAALISPRGHGRFRAPSR